MVAKTRKKLLFRIINWTTIIFFRLAFKQSWCALPTSSKESISDHLHYCAQKTSRAETQSLKNILKCLILQRFTSTQSKNIWIFATKFNLKIFIFWREIQIFEKLETQTKCEVKIQMRHFMWFSNTVSLWQRFFWGRRHVLYVRGLTKREKFLIDDYSIAVSNICRWCLPSPIQIPEIHLPLLLLYDEGTISRASK